MMVRRLSWFVVTAVAAAAAVSAATAGGGSSRRGRGAAFVDVAARVGLSAHRQHRASGLVAPNCLFDEPFSDFVAAAVLRELGGVLGEEEGGGGIMDAVRDNVLQQLEARDIGGFCLPERFTGGAAVGDINGDKWDDLVITSMVDPPSVYYNVGGTKFDAASAADTVTPAPPARTNGVALFDADNDGLLDMFFTTVGGQAYALFMQQPSSPRDESSGAAAVATPRFVDTTLHSNVGVGSPETGALTAGYSIAVGDYDCDGWLDIFVGEWRFDFLRPYRKATTTTTSSDDSVTSDSRLLRNMGGGVFEDVTVASGLSELVAFSRRRVGGRALDGRTSSLPTSSSLSSSSLPISNAAAATANDDDDNGGKREEEEVFSSESIPLRDFVPPGMFTFAALLQDLDDDGFPDLIVAADFGTSSIWWNDGEDTSLRIRRLLAWVWTRTAWGWPWEMWTATVIWTFLLRAFMETKASRLATRAPRLDFEETFYM